MTTVPIYYTLLPEKSLTILPLDVKKSMGYQKKAFFYKEFLASWTEYIHFFRLQPIYTVQY
ncbi:hypothetical protein CXP43_07020 [Bacillus velezensis]|nr:hypothetical protein CXP43_07020 [Bacillus velezensis]AWM47708.1 hypothetical protein DDT09_07545 [Bacillus amyloliquefaciens]PAF02057.1 hypothetical protein CHH68_05480 [Bacillus velezensis]QDP88086.1 hypothetical protein FGF55_07445 [Bacillus amyloliquefaciens]